MSRVCLKAAGDQIKWTYLELITGFSGSNVAGNIWDKVNTQQDKIYNVQKFVDILMQKCF